MRTTSQNGIELLKKFEGLRLTAYLCQAGVPTIGYGHTRTVSHDDVLLGVTISEATAEELLRQDLFFAESVVNRHGYCENQNQFDALVSFVFNVGGSAFIGSTLLKKIKEKAGEAAIRAEFASWVKSNGKRIEGLAKRRQHEAELYFS